MDLLIYALATLVGLIVLRKVQVRLRLSRAKHPSISGHAKISRRVAKLVPHYEYSAADAFASDGAPADVVQKRQAGFENLAAAARTRVPESIKFSAGLEHQVSDLQFTNAYRVPFQFRSLVQSNLQVPNVAVASDGVKIQNLDGNWAYDLGGSYGVNLLGYDFYKDCIEAGVARANKLGPVLGPYHPIIADNVRKLCKISGMEQVSFHMSGTEAVMQAVNLARYHKGRPNVVVFCGAYHGWWDGVQPGIGAQRKSNDIYMLKENSTDTLKVLETRSNIACVLVNPLQALHLNRGASSDAMLINSERTAGFDRATYRTWLKQLRDVCSRKDIVMILDEVFLGFRLGVGGAQEFFDVQADLVTYGKTLGGGLPVGVLCGKANLMKRYREDAPTDICFARGTFNSHPYVMASMNEFLRHATSADFKVAIDQACKQWDNRAEYFNERLQKEKLPLEVFNLSSVWIVTYTQPSRFNWMLQYYLRAQGLALSWVGTARFIFSHNYSDADFEEVANRFIAAANLMRDDGWWHVPAQVTNRSIKNQVFKEILSRRFNPG